MNANGVFEANELLEQLPLDVAGMMEFDWRSRVARYVIGAIVIRELSGEYALSADILHSFRELRPRRLTAEYSAASRPR
jgi:hypothetical protein